MCKIATLNSNLSSVIFISRIYAVNNKVVTIRAAKCFCIKITILDGQFACLYLYRSATTVVFTAINGQFCTAKYVNRITTIFTGINAAGCCLNCSICLNSQCCNILLIVPHVIRGNDGFIIQIKSNRLADSQTCISSVNTAGFNIFQQSNRIATLCIVKRILQRVIANFTNLSFWRNCFIIRYTALVFHTYNRRNLFANTIALSSRNIQVFKRAAAIQHISAIISSILYIQICDLATCLCKSTLGICRIRICIYKDIINSTIFYQTRCICTNPQVGCVL